MVENYNPTVHTSDELRHKCGVYQIRNLVNGKLYVGSSLDLWRRYLGHFGSLKKNKHFNSYLQRAFNKYGEDNFVFEIIEFCSKEQRVIREQYWIDTLNVLNNIMGYNIQPKAGTVTITEAGRKAVIESNKRRIHTPEQNKAQSELMSGKNNPMYGICNELAPSSRKIVCVEDKLAFKCIKLATNYYNLYKNGITRCLMGVRNTCGGKHWMYYEDYKEKAQLTWA